MGGGVILVTIISFSSHCREYNAPSISRKDPQIKKKKSLKLNNNEVSKQKTHHIRLSHNKQKSLDFSVRKKGEEKKKIPGLEDRGWRGESPAPQVLCVFLRLDQTPAKD